jgi:inorganic phosphate transporter, PiT family
MTLLITIIILALIFDYINGFHDAANSIATVVSTKVLTPFQAVLWAAVFNFAAFFIFKDHGVANTIAKTVKGDFITLEVIFSGLIAAITWNLITWWKGIPSSSSHTLLGGFAGAAITHAGGFHAIEAEPVIKTVSFIVLAPLVGMLIAFIISTWFLNSFRKGYGPKIFSAIVIIAVCWWIGSSIDLHPNASKVKLKAPKEKGQDVTAKLAGEDRHAYVVQVFDANIETINTAWIEKMKKSGATSVTGKDEIIAENVILDTVLKKTLTVYARTDSKDGKTSIKVAVKSDTNWVTAAYNKQLDSLAGAAVVGFGKKVTKAAPVEVGKMIIEKGNFKWFLLGFILLVMAFFTLWLSSLNHSKATVWFKRLQLVSSAAFSIGHGGNDAQKVMGIITAALICSHEITGFDQMPAWVPLACYAAIALGTMSGGWKIIKTMGTRITKVTPFEGVAAETAGAITLFVTENFKIPVSTTHTITGAIIGVGATKRLSAVRWGVTLSLVWAWVLTIPVSGILSALVYLVVTKVF